MDNDPRRLIGHITTGERAVAGIAALVLLGLALVEPDIVGAPFENARTIAFIVGGTVVAAALLVLMLRFDVPPVVRVVVLVVPFVGVSWWLLAPFFVDDVVDEQFATSIAAELEGEGAPATDSAGPTSSTALAATDEPDEPGEVTETVPSGPVLLAAGTFVGLAGHSGTGDAGIFENPDGTLALRFEAFDIENGPDLEVYLVPGADQTSLAAGAVHLGALKGNVGDQTYELPPDTDLPPGPYTALVWCEAFAVEFVGATLTIS